MKKVLFFCFLIGQVSFGQVYVESTDGAILITPKGLRGKDNGQIPYSGYNIALGANALEANIFGATNIAIGNEALNSHAKGDNNIGIGYYSLKGNFQGSNNVALGGSALIKNGGSYNTAVGSSALSSNLFSGYNVAIGSLSLYLSTTGENNTSVGYRAGYNAKTGSNNIFLGFQADVSDTAQYNSIAIGANTIVNASNKIRLGNDQITVIEGAVSFSTPSDRRLKQNILYTSALGLNFITRLRTTSYTYIADKTKMRHDGFIAQDVEQIMKELGVQFSGLKKSVDGTYSLAYSDFVMPLVNAVKELNRQQEEQQQKLERLEKQNELLLQMLVDLKEVKTEIFQLKAENSLRNSDKK